MNMVNTFVGAVGCFCLFNLSARRKAQVSTKVNSHPAYMKVMLLMLSAMILVSGPLFTVLARSFLFSDNQQGVNTYLLNQLFMSNIWQVLSFTFLLTSFFLVYMIINYKKSVVYTPGKAPSTLLINMLDSNFFIDAGFIYIFNYLKQFSYRAYFLFLTHTLFNLTYYYRLTLLLMLAVN